MSSQSIFTKLTAIIVDDELHGRENLKKIIETYVPEISIKGLADSVVNAVELVNNYKPEVVFLDINMPVLDGFDFLEEFDERNFMVVFVTAHEEFGIKAVKAGAADYILKPVNIKELKQTVKKLLTMRKNFKKSSAPVNNDKIVIPTSHGFDVVLAEDIIRLEAEGCYTKIIFKNGKNKIVSRTLKEFEDNVPKDKFFRIHKSHLINLNYIKAYSSVGGYYVTMIDSSKIEISRRKAPEFTRKIKVALKSV
ncbi:MAG: LytTR family DNA-binding domain-containing protein [Bacteroidota bacterium]